MEDYVGPATGRAHALCRLDEQIEAIQPTNRGDSADNRSGSADEKMKTKDEKKKTKAFATSQIFRNFATESREFFHFVQGNSSVSA